MVYCQSFLTHMFHPAAMPDYPALGLSHSSLSLQIFYCYSVFQFFHSSHDVPKACGLYFHDASNQFYLRVNLFQDNFITLYMCPSWSLHRPAHFLLLRLMEQLTSVTQSHTSVFLCTCFNRQQSEFAGILVSAYKQCFCLTVYTFLLVRFTTGSHL